MGNTDMIMSNNGYLYIACQEPGVYEVRKYDTNPASGLVAHHHFVDVPIKIAAVDTNVYVLEGYNLQSIDDTSDEVTLLQTYAFVGSTMEYDGVNLWVASGDTLYKCLSDGEISQGIVPNAGNDILEIKSAFGFIWVTYAGNISINISKVYPGLPGA